MEINPDELCVVRRTHAMEEIEHRLHNAMVVYVGGNRSEVSSELVLKALHDRMGIPADRVSVHSFRPEDFLVVFARQEDRA